MPGIFELLGKDHSEVKQMLTQLEKDGAGPRQGSLDQRKEKVGKLIAEESRHEAAEEKIFWPAVRDNLRDGDKLAATATSQESEAKTVLARLDKLDAGRPEFEKLLAEFAKAAREHVEFEETQVWPRMRRALSDQEASELGMAFQEAKEQASPEPQSRRRSSGGGRQSRVPAQRTRAELYEEARKLGVQGRSSMRKEELAREVARHR